MPMRLIPRLWWGLCARSLDRVARGRPIWHLRAMMRILRLWDYWLNPWYVPPGMPGGER